MSVKGRLIRLERDWPVAIDPASPHVMTVSALVLNDEPVPPVEAMQPCPGCGDYHVLREILVIVEPDDAGGPS